MLSKFELDKNSIYIAFNKPYAVLCQFTCPEGSTKQTLAAFDFPKNVYSIGRLDFDSEGLLVFTDDKRLNSELLSPSNSHKRIYYACVENQPTDDQLKKLCAGVIIEGKKTLPARARLLKSEPPLPPRPVPIRVRKNIPTAWIELTLTEGRNRQVRKMTAAVNCPTLRLVRVAINGLNLFDLNLAPGKWKKLSDIDAKKLFENC